MLGGVGSGSVSDSSAITRQEASFFFLKLVEWSEQLRSVTSVLLGAVRHRVQIRLCTERRVREKKLLWICFPALIRVSSIFTEVACQDVVELVWTS